MSLHNSPKYSEHILYSLFQHLFDSLFQFISCDGIIVKLVDILSPLLSTGYHTGNSHTSLVELDIQY